MPPYDDLIPGFANHTWQVHKFGGTSVADSNCFLRVATIIEHQLHDDNALVMDASKHHLAIVVSAMGGKPKVTDLLLRAVKYASLRDEEQVSGQLNVVLEKHRECLEAAARAWPRGALAGGVEDIRDILKTVSLMKWEAERISGEKHNLLLMRIINAVQCIYVFIYIIFLCSQYHSLIQRSFLATVNCIPPKFLLLF
jgi:aspartokinase/homoserine dehydrogenase 1